MRRPFLLALCLLFPSTACAAYNETPYAIDWLSPAAATYTTTVADNGRGLSAFNTSAGLAVTLPASSSSLPPGWHICAANDNGKTVTFNTASGHILIPKPSGGSASVTSLALPAGNYEMVCLMADTAGGNFRIIWASPQTEISLGMLAAGGNVSGPGAGTTAGWAPGWGNSAGTLLTDGYPVAGSGNNTIVETDSGGHIGNSLISGLPNSQLGTMGALTTKCNNTGSTATPIDCSTSQMQIMLTYPTTPGSTTAGFVPAYGDALGQTLTTGYPVAGTGNSTIPETDSGGHINYQVIPVMNAHAASRFTGSAGSVASGAGDCGTSPSLVGNDNVGRVTVGSSTNGGKCTVTFFTSWANPPVCSVWNESSGARQLWSQPSMTQLVILAQSTLTAADTLAFSCREYE